MPSDSNSIKANRSYHDRVSKKYDQIYRAPRWEAWFNISWDGVKPYLPKDFRTPILDVGCGTGKYGLRIAKSGFETTLQDLSQGMLDVCRRKTLEMGLNENVHFHQSDVMDLSGLPSKHFGLVVAQGDVLSFASRPPKAFKEIKEKLKPGGVLVASVDQCHAALSHYAEKLDLQGLEKLITRGEMEWLTRDPKEQFPVHTFTVERLRSLLDKLGFECLDLFGKTVLPFKKLESLLADKDKARKILALEKKLCRQPSALGLASHIQFAARLRA